MDTISSLSSKINSVIEHKPIFYITNDPERALGIENVLNNYHIVCIDNNPTVDTLLEKGVKIFSLEKHRKNINFLFRNSSKLLQDADVKEYIEKNSKSRFLQVFKPSSPLNKVIKSYNAELLNPDVSLNIKFENKFPQLDFLKKLGINLPKSEIIDVKDLNYAHEATDFGNGFLIQFNRGHTGTGTKKIDSEEELNQVKQSFPNWKVKVCQFIFGKTITLDAVATKKGVFIAGLSEQVTGHKHLTKNVFSTVGNNFRTSYFLTPELLVKVKDVTKKVGEAMYKEGFKGLFGLDLIVSGDDVYLIEINARQPASTSFVNKLLVLNEQIPLSLIHIAEFLDIDIDLNADEYSDNNMKSINAGQVIIRNTNTKDITIHESVENGFYRLQSDNSSYNWGETGPKKKSNVIYLDEEKDKPLVFMGKACTVEHIEGAGILITTAAEGRNVTPGSDICRIQTLQSLIDDNGNLYPWLVELVKKMKEIYRIM